MNRSTPKRPTGVPALSFVSLFCAQNKKQNARSLRVAVEKEIMMNESTRHITQELARLGLSLTRPARIKCPMRGEGTSQTGEDKLQSEDMRRENERYTHDGENGLIYLICVVNWEDDEISSLRSCSVVYIQFSSQSNFRAGDGRGDWVPIDRISSHSI